MKSLLSKTLILAGIALSATAANPEDNHFEDPEDRVLRDDSESSEGIPIQPKQPMFMSPFRAKGTLNPNVHLLSQLSTEPHPQVSISVVFPEHFPILTGLEFTQGVPIRVLTAVTNRAEVGNDTIYIQNFAGAFVDIVPSKVPGEKPTVTYT
jgi:hypothetical protein